MPSKADLSTEALRGIWRERADAFLASETGSRLAARLAACTANVYPPHPFRALELTPFESVRAVILGQDPYHTPGKACGLAFSVPEDEKLPPSLRNIFKVVAAGGALRKKGDLTDWARQGVLMLNPVLTVEEGRPLSHAGWGWEVFTEGLLAELAEKRDGLVFFLWGKPAQKLRPLIDEHRHLVLTASHPSPLSASRGEDAFLRSDCFRRANEWLLSRGEKPIDWQGAGEVGQASLF
ncbi:uracil-DNA glycosylase [Sutterella sp.]|uniref:uracil-DNA glycosylase n=1 Tax=Sutterella sp. TaxID=1981025 RepID=UPI0026DFF1C5|nr:uracil-DNA glycosylase [Sutterella sp.]MDO5532863.1 uracil-DNA glycosylase [Sutterella sp.]